MSNIKRFHPGVYIRESLATMEMTAREFSARTGISERTLSAIINGNGDITFDVAYKLSLYFDNSINYWTNLQNQYNIYLHEDKINAEIEEEWNLIKNIKKYLIDNNYISIDDNKINIVYKCRKLAGVNSLLLLTKKDSFVCLKETHSKKENDCFFQNFWISLALKEAREKKTIEYKKKELINSINEIRKMTVQEPNVFYPRLKEIFNNCGISFILLPYLPKSNIYGVTKWFSKDNVMIAISNRGGADLFWFTLFHEISHVLMEHRREALINMEGNEDLEADKMAQEMLIPMDKWENFVATKHYTQATISSFANQVGVHPCIVLGRLHKENEIPYSMFNKEFNLIYQIETN